MYGWDQPRVGKVDNMDSTKYIVHLESIQKKQFLILIYNE